MAQWPLHENRPTGDIGYHRVGGRADHRNSVGAINRDVGVFPVRGDGDANGVNPHRNRRHHRVAGPGNHRNSVVAIIRDVDVCPVRGDGERSGLSPTGTVDRYPSAPISGKP
jgi:hypothetical protein